VVPSCTTEGFEVILFKKERNLEGRAAVLEIQGSSRGLRNWVGLIGSIWVT